MTPLRTIVLMKTDIAGSTPRFRALLAADQQAVLHDHQAFVANHAAGQGGKIFKPTGDGFWLEFASVTAAARSAIAMQEALRLAQPNKGDERLSMRAVIGLGDVAVLDDDLIGELLALIARIEAITPADEIYLTCAARLALISAEVQTTLVDNFMLKGFTDPIAVYRVQQWHRTHVLTGTYILSSDLRGFTALTERESVATVERILDTLDALSHAVATEFSGTVRYSIGDSYCLTFPEASGAIAAAERLSVDWQAANRDGRFGCAINMALHRGKISAFRSFLYGEGMWVAQRVQHDSLNLLGPGEGGVFVTAAVRDELPKSILRSRLQPVALRFRNVNPPGLAVYRLVSPESANPLPGALPCAP
jgi:class 3 adenylate cyclase